jgi:hypothetical protein
MLTWHSLHSFLRVGFLGISENEMIRKRQIISSKTTKFIEFLKMYNYIEFQICCNILNTLIFSFIRRIDTLIAYTQGFLSVWISTQLELIDLKFYYAAK